MTEEQSKTWFASLPAQEKQLLILSVMHKMTIVFRAIVHESENEKSLRIAYAISELNHMFTSKLSAMITNTPTRSDEAVLDGFFGKFDGTELQPYFPAVWDAAVANLKQSRKLPTKSVT